MTHAERSDVKLAEQHGYRAGNLDQQTCSINWVTPECWKAWMAGWRRGQEDMAKRWRAAAEVAERAKTQQYKQPWQRRRAEYLREKREA